MFQFANSSVKSRVARFSLVQNTKTGKNIPDYHKIYQITTKYTRLPQNIPNGHKIFPMAVIQTKWSKNLLRFSIARPSKIDQNWDFWFENKPSVNPG
jgi:hypothetical protein